MLSKTASIFLNWLSTFERYFSTTLQFIFGNTKCISCVYLKHKIYQPLYNVHVKIGTIVMLLWSIVLSSFLFKPGRTKWNLKMPSKGSLNAVNIQWGSGAIVLTSWPCWLMSSVQSELGKRCSWFPSVFQCWFPWYPCLVFPWLPALSCN